MFKKIVTLSALSLGIAVSMNAVASDSMSCVGVVDMQSILHSAPQVEKINADLKTQFSARKDALLTSAKSLQANMANLSKNKAVMKHADLAALQRKVSSQEAKMRIAQMRYQQDLMAAQNKAMSGFLTELKGAVNKVAIAKHLKVVMPKNNLLYSAADTDVTAEVLKNLK